jgi:hypothetical protein
MILTKKLLQQHGACETGIEFCERNKLFGFDSNRINAIKGDYYGFVTWFITMLSNTKGVKYDDRGNLIQFNYHNDDIITYYEYDDLDNKILMTRGGGWIRYEYDDLNRMVNIIYSSGCYITYTYNDDGLLISISEADNPKKTIMHQYDERKNLILKTCSSTGITYRYAYDQLNRKLSEERITKLIHSSIKTWEYDIDGNITKLNGDDFSCVYDKVGNITAHIYYESKDTRNHIIQYYDNGQLKQYDDLYIPLI